MQLELAGFPGLKRTTIDMIKFLQKDHSAVSTACIAEDTPIGSEVGHLVYEIETGEKVQALFLLEDNAGFLELRGGDKVCCGTKPVLGKHKLVVRAIFEIQRQITVPMAGIVATLECASASGDARSTSHRIVDDPTGIYVCAGDLLLPKHQQITVSTTFRTEPQVIEFTVSGTPKVKVK